jgi:hypothetical protein
VGVVLRDLVQFCVGNTGDFAWRQRRDAVIHSFDKEAMKVDEIAGDMDGGDLPSALG